MYLYCYGKDQNDSWEWYTFVYISLELHIVRLLTTMVIIVIANQIMLIGDGDNLLNDSRIDWLVKLFAVIILNKYMSFSIYPKANELLIIWRRSTVFMLERALEFETNCEQIIEVRRFIEEDLQ